MSAFSKIKVENFKRNKSVHNLSRDVNTTAEFGFCQPTNLIEVIPGDTVTIQTKSFARLMPMVVPTFGRVLVKTYHRFVPMVDIHKNFENLLSGTIVKNQTSQYVPTKVPSLSVSQLSLFVAQFCDITYYTYNHSTKNLTIDTSVPDKYLWSQLISANLSHIILDENITRVNGDSKVTLDGADFVVECAKGASSSTIAALRLKVSGKNLRKVLIGLGYQLDFVNNINVSLLPLFAFYKAYFDTQAVQRNLNWSLTNCYRLIDFIFENNITSFYSYIFGDNTTAKNYFYNFMVDLDRCYYNCDPDYFTAAIDHPAINEIGHNPLTNSPTSFQLSSNFSANQNTQPFSTINSTLGIASLKVAQVLYNRVNSQSVFGASVRKYLESVYGAKSLTTNDAYNIGTSQFTCDISDVMNMAESSEAVLGEFAGRGLGSGGSEQFTFKNGLDTFGYIVSYLTVVPVSGYVQGIDRNLMHLHRYDFADPQLDAIGFQLTQKGEYVGASDVYNYDDIENLDYFTEGFGFIPRYTEYKTQPHNILNGDLSRRATRNSMLPYTLDRWYTTRGLTYKQNQSQGVASDVSFTDGYTPTVVNSYMRTIGMSGAMGNFNRIFVDNGVQTDITDISKFGNYISEDQFIIHNVYDVKRISVLKPISESFEAGEDGSFMTVEHQ